MTDAGQVAAAILAAGRGRRFGGRAARESKVLAEWRGRPLVAWACDAALASGLRPVLLVTGYRARRVGAAAPAGVSTIVTRRWRRGIARSVRAALAALEGCRQVGAVCIGLADQPLVGPDAYRRLAAAYASGAVLAVATYRGVRANPVVVGRVLWAEARRVDGDEGIRALMRTHPVVEVPCDGTGDARDVDTIEDLHAIEGG